MRKTKMPEYYDDRDDGCPPKSFCPYCNTEWQTVRPGKSQPNCDCQDEVIMRRWELRKIEKTLMNMKKMLKKDLRVLEK